MLVKRETKYRLFFIGLSLEWICLDCVLFLGRFSQWNIPVFGRLY